MRTVTYHVSRVGLLLFGVLCILLSLKLSTYRFGASDFSEMIDSGWRIVSGQVPGRDFVCTFPPSFYLFIATMYRHFGVTWHSLALGEALFFAVLCLLGWRLTGLLRSVLGTTDTFFVFLFYFVGQMIPLISINLPWHASIAQSIACYAILTTFVLLKRENLSMLLRVELFLHLTLGLTGLILSKPNTAYPPILLCLVLLAMARTPKWLVWGSLAASLVAASVVLSTAHISLLGMLDGYQGLSGRLVPHPLAYGMLLNRPGVPAIIGLANLCVYAMIAPVLTLFGLTYWRERHDLLKRPLDLLALGACATGILGMATNFDLKLTDTPLVLLGIALFSVTGASRALLIRRRLIWTTLPLVYFCFLTGTTRQRGQTIGLWANEDCGARITLHDPFFGTFHNCAVFGSVMQEADRTLASGPANQRVFFGPDLEFMYARNRIVSPLHLPLWWHPGTSYPLGHLAEINRAWHEDRFDTVIFVHDLRANTPQAIQDELRDKYVQVPGTELIDVYKPRAAQPPAGQ